MGVTEPELWSLADVAQYLGVKPDSARGQLSRWGIRAAGSRLDPQTARAVKLYPAQEVRDRHASRPGAGARTDLTGTG